MKKNPKSFFENTSQVLIVLIVPALILYARSLKFDFTSMDEQWMIIKDTAFLAKWSSVKDAFVLPSTDIYYRPLFMISLIVDYHIGKLSPFIYHFTNLAWHVLCVVLLYKFLIKSEADKKTSFFLALLFSVHPLLLHAVAWVPGRNDIMLSVFTLASLIHLKNYSDTGKFNYLFFHLLFFTCALFTKESAVVLPLLFLAFYLVFGKPILKSWIGLLFFWIGLAGLWLLLRQSVVGSTINSSNDFLSNAKNTALGFLLFIGKAIYPIQQSVLPTLKNASLLPGILTLIIIIVLIFKPGLKNSKIALLGLFFFFILLLVPVWFGASKSGSEHYEQRAYGAMAGIMMFFTQVKFDPNSKPIKYFFCVFFLLLIVKTGARMGIYKNEMSFLDAGIKECPDYYLFYIQKADLLNGKNDFKSAINYYDKAIAIRPDYPEGLSNRGSAYFSMGLYKEAAADFSRAIDHSTFNKLYHLNRCIAYYRMGDVESAMKDLVILKKCCQELIKTELEKGIMDTWIDGMEALKRKLNTDSNNAALYYKIATLYFDIEMNVEGLQYIHQAGLLDPTNVTYKALEKSHAP